MIINKCIFIAGWRRHIRSVSTPQSERLSTSTSPTRHVERYPFGKVNDSRSLVTHNIMATNLSSGSGNHHKSNRSTINDSGMHHHHHQQQRSSMGKRASIRPRWHFGIRSQGRPIEVMDEVYRALSNIGMEWKCIDPFHLRARYVGAQGLFVKIDLQLYTMDNHLYLLDFCQVQLRSPFSATDSNNNNSKLLHNTSCNDENDTNMMASRSSISTVSSLPLVAPSTTITTATSMAKGFIGQSPFPFFDVCSRLITELALSS